MEDGGVLGWRDIFLLLLGALIPYVFSFLNWLRRSGLRAWRSWEAGQDTPTLIWAARIADGRLTLTNTSDFIATKVRVDFNAHRPGPLESGHADRVLPGESFSFAVVDMFPSMKFMAQALVSWRVRGRRRQARWWQPFYSRRGRNEIIRLGYVEGDPMRNLMHRRALLARTAQGYGDASGDYEFLKGAQRADAELDWPEPESVG